VEHNLLDGFEAGGVLLKLSYKASWAVFKVEEAHISFKFSLHKTTKRLPNDSKTTVSDHQAQASRILRYQGLKGHVFSASLELAEMVLAAPGGPLTKR
jgi:hypothetical protein